MFILGDDPIIKQNTIDICKTFLPYSKGAQNNTHYKE
jgi:hypothetical protein